MQHVFVPDVKRSILPGATELLIALIVLCNHDEFDPLEPGTCPKKPIRLNFFRLNFFERFGTPCETVRVCHPSSQHLVVFLMPGN